jgi:hypothetical protein
MIANNDYDIDDFTNPADRTKSRIGAAVFFILVVVCLVLPWYDTVYPLPEAEGLMASFGNVEIAGGDAQPTENVEPVEEKVEEVETIDDKESPVIEDVKENKDPKPTPVTEPTNNNTVNPNSLFNGTGTGNGNGQQGDPNGSGDLGGTGNGDKGTGDGKLGSRKNIRKCEDYKKADASWQESGKAVVDICVNANGEVVSAKINRRKSTITSQSLIDLVVGCANYYKYEKVPGAGNACGEITIKLGLN